MFSWAGLAAIVLVLAGYRKFVAREEDFNLHVPVPESSPLCHQESVARRLGADRLLGGTADDPGRLIRLGSGRRSCVSDLAQHGDTGLDAEKCCRRGSGSNRRIKVLQTFNLWRQRVIFHNFPQITVRVFVRVHFPTTFS